MPPLTPDAWAQIRYAYEYTDRPVEGICLDHGITANTLRDRMRRWGWTPRRRPPVPRVGPPALAAPAYGITAGSPLPAGGERSATLDLIGGSRVRGRNSDSEPVDTPPHPDPLPASGERENSGAAPPMTDDTGASEPAPSDPASVAERLQNAVVRVLPAIEATIARLAGETQHPREMAQTARALGVLMRTLRELNTLLSQQPLRAATEAYDDMPEDMDAFRNELARRIRAFCAAREAQSEAEMLKRVEAAWLGLGDEVAGES